MKHRDVRADGARTSGIDQDAVFCIDELARRYGRPLRAMDLGEHPWLRTDRASMREIAFLAEQIGINTRIVRVDEDELRLLRAPAVVAVSGLGLCILEKTRGARVLLRRRGQPPAWHAVRDIMAALEEDAIETSPPGPIEMSREGRASGLYDLVRNSVDLRSSFAQLAILSVVMQTIVLIGPFFLQVVLDRVVPTQDSRLLVVLALGFGLFALVGAFATGLRVLVVTAAGTSLGFDLASALFRRLVVLPLEWFEGRELGQILVSFRSSVPIQKTLAENAPLIVIDGLLGVTNLLVMFLYAPLIAAISACAFSLYALIRMAFFRSQRVLQDSSLRASGAEHAIVLETLRSMTTIRSLGLERLRHATWQAAQMRSTNADFRFRVRAGWQDAMHAAVYGIENVAVVGLGAYLVIADRLSIGMLFAYLVYKAQFLTAGASLVEKALEIRMLNVHLARIEEIASQAPLARLAGASARPFAALMGRIELSDIVHSFSGERDPVLKGIDLVIEAGESLVITGPSGCGKSTLAKILVGLIVPREGEVFLDGTALDAIGYQHFRLQVASVLQEDRLLAGTIAENVSAFEETPDQDAIAEALRIAGIASEVSSMPFGTATRIGDLDTGLSGGQRQRLLIARALYRRPRILLLDEATSQLDEAREQQINAAIAGLGMTRIIVAHRRSTIDSADRVVELRSGRISSDTRRA